MPKPNDAAKLTRDETRALWHAVDDMGLMVREMKSVEGIRIASIEVAELRLAAAKRALRQVNKLRTAGY
jgi:hypothetical protein